MTFTNQVGEVEEMRGDYNLWCHHRLVGLGAWESLRLGWKQGGEAEAEAPGSGSSENKADPEAEAVSKLGSGSGSGSSWLLISGSGSGGFFKA